MRHMIPVLAAILAGVAPAGAQTLRDIEAREAELNAAWEKTPLTVRRVMFVTEKPALFGGYTERPTNVFKPGEIILTYIEPIGFSWTPGQGGFGFGVVVDFRVKTQDGKILGGQEKLLTLAQASRSKVHELMINIDLTLTGAEPGDYVLEYTLHDPGNGRTATTEQAFRIAN